MYFSPTGTTKTVVKEIAGAFEIQRSEDIDFTHCASRQIPAGTIQSDQLTVIGVPVYSGRIPVPARDYIETMQVEKGSPAVTIAVYGNRHYDDALLELKQTCEQAGFSVYAAAVFIGEHSMSTPALPISPGRPDQADREKAREFGRSVAAKLAAVHSLTGTGPVSVPGNPAYKKRPYMPKAAPKIDKPACTLCGTCVDVCPAGAIRIRDGSVFTDKNLCIVCQACVKTCPEQARRMTHPAFALVTRQLHSACRTRREPELFL